ncbi:ABC transporter permease [Lawsonibacter celer]|jgi:ABC-type uncharacterized transport system permease subunit|uniref:ABC transporter permease n=1 Tax=Lawsonibacter celer TaxID=2986526 RepID=UPI0016441E21|nr:ABC transporter permease [Lawsonibacter celer]
MLDWITNFLSSDIMTATPLLITALGAVYSERAGILNIGNEGLMLTGAFFGATVSWITGSAFVGAVAAMAAAMVLNLILAFFVITVKANQVVAGLAINTLASGLTVTLNRLIFGVSTTVPKIDVFDKVAIPGLCKIPVIGEAFFNQSLVVYLTYLLVPVLAFVLKRTNIGLKIRSVGEHPQACDTVGISVTGVRYGTMLFAGALAGLGGAFTSMGQLSFFVEDMVSGRGYMALAAVVFGNYTPVGVMGACLMFGAASALQYRLQTTATWIPYQFWIMLPYVITIIALCCYRKKSNRPACHGQAYAKM